MDPTEGMSRVPIQSLPVTLLPSVTVKINGVEMPALLDTGSPITVLNAQAAKAAGVETVKVDLPQDKSNNPFANFANNIKAAKAAANGDILQLAGANGAAVALLKSSDEVDMAVVGDNGPIGFGKGNIYVGDLPGLAALDGIGENSPPAVVLGMDVLRTKTKMLYRGQQNEVYFEQE